MANIYKPMHQLLTGEVLTSAVVIPAEQTVEWDIEEYEFVSLVPGKLILKRKGEMK